MKYILNQKIFSFGDDFYIEDEHGKKVFIVDNKLFSIGEKLWFKDIDGNKLFLLKQKLVKLTDTYVIEKDNKEYARIKKKMFTLFKEKFSIETPYGDIEAKGNFIDYNFDFFINGNKIAEVSKKFISIRDKYVIKIDSFSDDALIIACAVAIDMIVHNDKNNNN